MTDTHRYNLNYYYKYILNMKKGSLRYDYKINKLYWLYSNNSEGYGKGYDPESEKYIDIINELID